MEKKLTKEIWEKAKAKGVAKRLEKPADAEKLSDADMANVAGGFIDENFEHGSFLQWVQCPRCSEARQDKLSVYTNDFIKGTTYTCNSCGCKFFVDDEGFTSDLDFLEKAMLLGD